MAPGASRPASTPPPDFLEEERHPTPPTPAFGELLGLLDEPDPGFAIVTPD